MKKIISLLLALVMVLSLAACGPKEEAPAETQAAAAAPEAPAAAEKVEVTMIAAQYGNETADWWANFVAKFNEANPDINLVVDVVSWNDIYTVVNTRVANGEAPDLLNIDVFADFVADGLLLPAEDWCSEETYAKFFPSFLAESVVDDVVWTITKGDPANRTDTLVTYLYRLAFYNGKQGEAAAVSVIGFLILLACASVYMVSTLKKGDE